MTPTVFAVSCRTLAPEIVRMMLELKVHHLFVADDDGTLVGVISLRATFCDGSNDADRE